MFEIKARGSTVGREVLGGITTFMAMSYIVFVQVGLLGERGKVGMDDGGVLMALCISSAAACFLMGLIADYPIALAPGMGENYVFVSFAVTMGAWQLGYEGWQLALVLTAATGVVFLVLAFVGLRSQVLNSIPDSLKSGIAAGIGLLIARAGFENSNLLQAMGPGTIGGLRDNPAAWVALVGLAITLALLAFRVRGAILIGILAGTGFAMLLGQSHWQMPFESPGGIETTAGGFVEGLKGVGKAFSAGHALELLLFAGVLLMMDLFDTVGTLVGVAGRAGMIRAGELPRAERALAADAAGTLIGGCLGSSTVTSYVESVTGVEAGARTGLAAIVTGLLLLLTMFCKPLVQMVMGDFQVAGEHVFPTIAPALIVVGAMMLRAIREIDWDNATEFIPAFLIVLVMPLTFSISDGIAMGFISYAFAKLVTGRVKECPILVYVFAVLFIVRYAVAAA